MVEALDVVLLEEIALVGIVRLHLLPSANESEAYHTTLKVHPKLVASSFRSVRTVTTRHFACKLRNQLQEILRANGYSTILAG